MKRKLLSMILALATVFGVMTALASCGDKDNDDVSGGSAESFVALDINPSLELTVDEDGYVLSAYGANEDAQVLLYGESGIVGVKLESAVERITSLAIELGYINEGNKVVSTSVYASSDSAKASLEGRITASVNKAAGEAGFTLTVSSEELYSLIRDLEVYKEQNPNSTEIQALTPAKYRLALSASESGELTIDAAIKLDNAELIKRINDAHKKAEAFATRAFNAARAQASAAYELAVELAEAGVYLEYFASNPLKSADAALYLAYTSAANGLEALEIAAEWIDEDGYELNAQETAAILLALGLTEQDKALISNGEGKVTIRSVEAYANKVLKGMGRAEREALEDRLDDLIDEAEDRIELLVDQAIGSFKPQVDAIMAAAKTAVAPLRVQAALAPAINAMVAEFDEIVAEYDALIADGELSEDDLEELEELFEDKLEDIEDDIMASISPEDKAELDAKRAEARARLREEKAEFDRILAEAEADAKAYLENLKNARKQQ